MNETSISPQYIKDPNRLTKILILFLWIFLFSNALGIIIDVNVISLFNDIKSGETVTDAKADASDQREALFAIGWLILFIITGIIFLKWIYRANANCRGFGAHEMKFSSGWSVGWYFIPFMNLFKPFKAMEEIWLVSHKGPQKWQMIENAAKENKEKIILNLWWIFWIGSFALSQLSSRSYNDAENVESLINSYYISIADYCWAIILTLIAIKLVKAVQDSQNRLVEKVISSNPFSRDS